jgi:cytosine/adenosine deaminase-related metal-dependent hydrolase
VVPSQFHGWQPARLISAPWVLPIATPAMAEAAVVVDGAGSIVAVVPRAEIKLAFASLPEERAQGALLPGLVNAHTHVELSVLAGRLHGGEGLPAWAVQVGRETAAFSVEQRCDAARRAALAAAAAGTAAVGDVGNTLAAVPALANAGMAGVFFHELLGSREAATGDALADAEREYQEFIQASPWPANLARVPAPHALYSAGPDLLRRIFAAAAGAGHPTSIHVAEGEDEIQLLRDGTGRWAEILASLQVPAGSRTPGLAPLAYLESLGAFAGDRPPLLVHMVCAGAEDIALAKKHRAPVVLCPRSNLHIGGRLPDVPAFLSARLTLALGTDSLGSSPDLSLWGEMAALASHFPDIAPEIWLRSATAGGAAALGLHALGALAPGKRPGIIDVTPVDTRAPCVSLVATAAPSVRWVVRP